MRTLEECRGLWVLPPVRNPLAAKYFPENTHQILLAALDEKFDYVVIDGGDDANLGLTISAPEPVSQSVFRGDPAEQRAAAVCAAAGRTCWSLWACLETWWSTNIRETRLCSEYRRF